MPNNVFKLLDGIPSYSAVSFYVCFSCMVSFYLIPVSFLPSMTAVLGSVKIEEFKEV